MEIHIEWDRKYYPYLCSDDSYISKDASACLNILKEIDEDKTERFEITKKNLNYLRSQNIKHWNSQTLHDKNGKIIKSKWFDDIGKKIFDYIIGTSNDLSFLNEINNQNTYQF